MIDAAGLRVMRAIADCGSFTTAATRLHSTQSTVSQKVRRLEELAGHRLLERGHRDVHPTDAGHAYMAARIAPLIYDQLTVRI